MLTFFEVLFFSIGFMISVFGVGFGVVTLIENIRKARIERDERFKRIIQSLERIEKALNGK